MGDFWGFWQLCSFVMAGQVRRSWRERLGAWEKALHWLTAWQVAVGYGLGLPLGHACESLWC